MKKYFIDEHETFAINDELGARVEIMGWEETPIIYIDNFYKYPDKVRDLTLRVPGTKNNRVCAGLPGVRVDMNMDLDNFFPVWKEMLENVYGLTKDESVVLEQSMRNVPFSVNVTQSEGRDRIPHVDFPVGLKTRGWAGIIYLNKDDECNGGTGFYTYKGMQINPKSEECKDIPRDKYITDSDGDWELIHLAEMKYNRMVFYPDSILHGAYDKDLIYKDDLHRLVQVFFLPLHFPWPKQ